MGTPVFLRFGLAERRSHSPWVVGGVGGMAWPRSGGEEHGVGVEDSWRVLLQWVWVARAWHARKELDVLCRQWEAMEDFRAGEGQEASWLWEDGLEATWSGMEAGSGVGTKPLMLRTIHCTGFVVARSAQAGHQGRYDAASCERGYPCTGPGGSPISPASITGFPLVSTFPVTHSPEDPTQSWGNS